MEATKIKIAKDYSPTPGPRSEDEGSFSGEIFRKNILLDAVRRAVQKDEILLIDLDGTAGYAPSFLEESFGGLIRDDGFTYDILLKHLEFKSDEEPYLIDEILEYMADAEKEPKKR